MNLSEIERTSLEILETLSLLSAIYGALDWNNMYYIQANIFFLFSFYLFNCLSRRRASLRGLVALSRVPGGYVY